MNVERDQANEDRAPGEAYEPPVLVEFGPVVKLTMGTGGEVPDCIGFVTIFRE